MKNKKYWIIPGIEVAHKDNSSQKMIVERLLKRSVKMPPKDEKEEQTQQDDNTKIQSKTFITGVECHWWEGEEPNLIFVKGRFHTKEIVPFKIAELGYVEIVKWFDNQNKLT